MPNSSNGSLQKTSTLPGATLGRKSLSREVDQEYTRQFDEYDE